jgi:hypothetical protein
MDTSEQLIAAVTETLAKLETHGSAEQIRGFFEAQEITGLRGSSTACPVQTYLVRETGESCISVSRNWTNIIAPSCHGKVPNSPAVESFIDQFDAGRFPELETL